MSLIDDRGRLFGKFNLIDAVVVIFVVLLLPLAYGAYRLFRAPAPFVDSMQPVAILDQTPTVVAITGRNLRPFLRANVGGMQAQFLVESPTAAEIKVPGMAAGTYDVSLWDESNRVWFKPGALTVQATDFSSAIDLEAVGSFVGLSKEITPLIAVGTRFQTQGAVAAAAQVLAVGPPEAAVRRLEIGNATVVAARLPSENIPAIVRITCTVANSTCMFGGAKLLLGQTMLFPLPPAGRSGPATSGEARFVVNQIFPSGVHAGFPSVVTARIRFVGSAEISNVIKVGETDVSAGVLSDTEHSVLLDSNRAVVLTAASEARTTNAQVTVEQRFNVNQLRRSFELEQPVVAINSTVRIPVAFTPSGWVYKERPVKVGAPFTFESIGGTATGWILEVNDSRGKSGDGR